MVFERLLNYNANILLLRLKYFEAVVIYKISIVECMRWHMYNYSLV
jgi:hypothetical protein